jgi:hypothetical protein
MNDLQFLKILKYFIFVLCSYYKDNIFNIVIILHVHP